MSTVVFIQARRGGVCGEVFDLKMVSFGAFWDWVVFYVF